MSAVFFALLALGSFAQPSSAIPPESGEATNEMLNQAAQNGAAGGVPAVPPIGDIQGHVPGAPGIPQFILPTMPLEQRRLIAAQRGAMPTSPPSFYIPNKPRLNVTRAANTGAFTTALEVICLNAAWDEPVAILMCSSGLVGITYKLSEEVVLFMAKNLN